MKTLVLLYIYGRSYGSVPHDSTQGVPAWFTPVGLGILLYLGIRMYFAVKKKK